MRFHIVARRVTPLLAMLFSASACAYLIPDNPSTPRYNKVVGEMHRPQKNAQSLQVAQANIEQIGATDLNPTAMPPAMLEQQRPVVTMEPTAAAPTLPPVDAKTQQIAEEQLKAQPPLQERTIVDRAQFWSADPMPPSNRAVPMENAEAARTSDYPVLGAVPAKPATATTDAERLEQVRSQLEQDRAAANNAAANLKRDAAAEPSILSELPPTTPAIPAPEPVGAAPLPAAAPDKAVPSVGPGSMLAPAPQGTISSALPPPPAPLLAQAPALAPAPAPAPAFPAGPAPIQMDALPMGNPAPAPALAAAPQPHTLAVAPAPAAPMAVASAGSFNPMNGGAAPIVLRAPQTSSYATTNYLPASRYVYRR